MTPDTIEFVLAVKRDAPLLTVCLPIRRARESGEVAQRRTTAHVEHTAGAMPQIMCDRENRIRRAVKNPAGSGKSERTCTGALRAESA